MNGFDDTLHAAAGSTISVGKDQQGSIIYADNATINVADEQSVVVYGSNDVINGGDDGEMTITGTGNSVTATNSIIVFNGVNTGDTVAGAGDSGSNWSAPDGDLPPNDSGGYSPPRSASVAAMRLQGSASGAASASPDPNLLVHGVAAFLSQGSGGSFNHLMASSIPNDHLHLAMAS
jgi:hypothetical protein